MKAAILAAAVFAGLSAAQLGDIPKCAQQCASEQFSGDGYSGCGTDAKCICESDQFLSTVACCLIGVCSEDDQAKAVAYAQQICSAQGVKVPTAVSCTTGASSTGAAATPTASGSGSAATTGAATTGSGSSSGGSAATTGSSNSGSAATAAVTSSSSSAFAPQQTGAMRGAEILGGLVAAVAML